jgi:hypothetical protein
LKVSEEQSIKKFIFFQNHQNYFKSILRIVIIIKGKINEIEHNTEPPKLLRKDAKSFEARRKKIKITLLVFINLFKRYILSNF